MVKQRTEKGKAYSEVIRDKTACCRKASVGVLKARYGAVDTIPYDTGNQPRAQCLFLLEIPPVVRVLIPDSSTPTFILGTVRVSK